jgi:hypothetical protein
MRIADGFMCEEESCAVCSRRRVRLGGIACFLVFRMF